jgi:aryl-alcohol dehydrogenase-like predicted oxidoreductase
MELQRFGNSDMRITPLGFGAWAIGGGDWAFGWGPQDDAESVAAVRRALDHGINWIDTAAVYGLGRSEEVVRRALEGLPAGSRPYVFTKCSLVWNERREVSHSLEPASIRREVEGSLRRLGVDTIDLYQIHWPGFPPGGPSPGLEAAWETMADLQRAGKVRYIGASNFDAAQLARVQPIAPVTSLQPPYSMLMRGIEQDVLPYCRDHGIGVIAYSPMQSGLLTGSMTRERIAAFPADDWRRNSPEFQEPRLSRNLELVELLRAIGLRHGRSPGEVAIAWVLRHPAVTGAIVGARRPEQVDGWIGAAAFRLSVDEAGEIEAMLPESADVKY